MKNENNSSKARTYLFFAVALLLMGAGLFGSFYTLMGGMNAGKLAGKTVVDHYDYKKPVEVKCFDGGTLRGYFCDYLKYMGSSSEYGGANVSSSDCISMGFQSVVTKDVNEGQRPGVPKKEFYCYKKYSPRVFCSDDDYQVVKKDLSYWCKVPVYKTVTTKKKKAATSTTTTKRYYQTPTTTSKTTTKAPLKNLQLTCKTKDGKVLKNNSSVYTGTQIICETDVTGATFKATGFKNKTSSSSDKKYTFKYKKSKTSATIKVSKSGYKTNTISFKVLELQDLKLTCKQGNQTLKEGSTVTVYRPITCTVNTNGVRFKATGKKAVTLTGSKKVYDFKYTKGKDSATIKASKDGYKTKTIKFKVTDDMKITSNNKKAFKIYCPTKVRAGDKFVCYVSEEYRGATITTKFNDEKEVVAAKNTKILYLKYDKPGTLKVSAKYGKNTLDRTIKIVDSETASKTKVHLNCSRTEVNSNEKFYCFSRIDGVQIKMDSKCKLNSGFNSTMTTSFANDKRLYRNYFSCSKGDDTIVTVTATKDGYVSNSRTINIK